MSRPLRQTRWSIAGLVAAALAVAGCGGAKERPPAPPTTITLYVPCVIGGPVRRAVAAYEAAHPEVIVAPHTYKPLEKLPDPPGPAVLVTAGDLEMTAFVEAGVAQADVRTFAVNTYPLAAVVPAGAAADLDDIADLARPSITRIFLENPNQSTLGARAVEGLRKLGLWEAVGPKIVPLEPGAMVLGEMLAGKADAAIVFKGCLLGEAGESTSPPKTIRVIGEIPLDLHRPIPYQAAALRAGPTPDIARTLVEFLAGNDGMEALAQAGLTPAANP